MTNCTLWTSCTWLLLAKLLLGSKQAKYLFFCLNSRKGHDPFALMTFCLSIFLLCQRSPLTCRNQYLLRSTPSRSDPSKSAPQHITFSFYRHCREKGRKECRREGKLCKIKHDQIYQYIVPTADLGIRQNAFGIDFLFLSTV